MSIISKTFRELQFFRTTKFGSLWNYLHGFSKDTVINSGITKDNYKDFISDRDYLNGHPYNGVYTYIIDNKLYLPFLLKNYPEVVPTYFYFKDAAGFLPFEQCTPSPNRHSMEDFLRLLQKQGRLVLKHCYSSLGIGFMLAEYRDDAYLINKKAVSKEELVQIVDGLENYIVTDYVVQHSYSSSICSSSLNTLRLLCVWDSQTKHFFVARAFHRFGCNGNVVDNVGSGNGLLVFVDPETGKFCSSGIMNSKKSGEVYVENIVHPDHQLKLEGIVIPNYQSVKERVLAICDSISFLRYVGIDVALTEEGFKIIEFNSLPSVEAVQQRTGFMVDARIRKVLKK